MNVTIVMSTFNGEQFLKEQIDSILCQKNADVVLFIRDDGSQDGTLEILKEYAARYDNIMFVAGDNLGAGKSFYEALKLAPDSPYYAFSDQDDVWLPDKMKAGIDALESCRCDVAEIPLLYTCRPIPVDSKLKTLNVKELHPDITFGTALLENQVSACTFVFNRKARDLFLRFPFEHICIHDWDMLRIVLAVGGKVLFDENGHILYRQHGFNTVGADVSRKHRARKLLGRHVVQKLGRRLEFADQLREIYADIMPDENLRILNELCDYKKTFSSRMTLVKSKEIVRTDRTDNFVFKTLFLFGLL